MAIFETPQCCNDDDHETIVSCETRDCSPCVADPRYIYIERYAVFVVDYVRLIVIVVGL